MPSPFTYTDAQPCYWPEPYTTVTLLPFLSATNQVARPLSISSDGSTIYGTAQDNAGIFQPVKWSTITNTITQITNPFGTHCAALQCTPDAGEAYGGKGIFIPGQGGVPTLSPVCVWSGGGASATILPPPSPLVSLTEWFIGPRFMPGWNISDDGAHAWAFVNDPSLTPHTVLRWDSNVPAYLPANAGSLSAGTFGINGDGTALFGNAAANTYPISAAVWDLAGAETQLPNPTDQYHGAGPSNSAEYATADGVVVWFSYTSTLTIGLRYAYTTSDITTTPMQVLTNSQEPSVYCSVNWVARTPTATPVAIGNCPTGANFIHAVKWEDAVITDLGTYSGGTNSDAYGCDANGTVVCGVSYDSGFNTWPIWWNNGNTLTQLPVPAPDPAGFTFQGMALGVSNDASKIFGVVVPPSPPSVVMELANLIGISTISVSPCTEFNGNTPTVPGPAIWLEWSDDRGKTYGTPVAQSMGFENSNGDGDPALTQPSWRRTGYARDRVFQLIWSAAFPTAVNGAYIDVKSMKT